VTHCKILLEQNKGLLIGSVLEDVISHLLTVQLQLTRGQEVMASCNSSM